MPTIQICWRPKTCHGYSSLSDSLYDILFVQVGAKHPYAGFPFTAFR